MTDYFALLDQPRSPWLDPDELRNTYHQKTLQAHPDTQASRGAAPVPDASFTDLNEAYQVLQDPKRRLHHLLSLEGAAPSSTDQTVPKQLDDLFPRVSALTRTRPAAPGKTGRHIQCAEPVAAKAGSDRAARDCQKLAGGDPGSIR